MERQRYDGLDALRAGAMVLGLAYHATTSWLPDVGPWYFVEDTSPVSALVAVSGLLHAFRMPLFFALSGFFSHLVFERRGAKRFLTDRSRRLLWPLLVALPLVLGVDFVLRNVSAATGHMSAQFELGTSVRTEPMHLWFLIYLWGYCAVAVLLPSWELPSQVVTRALRFPPTLLLLSGPTCLGLALHPSTRPHLHLWPTPFEFVHFGVFFAFGWWLWAARTEVTALRRHAAWMLSAGLGLGVWVFQGPLQWSTTGHVLGGLVAWLVTLGALGVGFTVRLSSRPWLTFVVAASYWVYLVHYPLVQALQLGFAELRWPGLVEYVLTVLVAAVVPVLGFRAFVEQPTVE